MVSPRVHRHVLMQSPGMHACMQGQKCTKCTARIITGHHDSSDNTSERQKHTQTREPASGKVRGDCRLSPRECLQSGDTHSLMRLMSHTQTQAGFPPIRRLFMGKKKNFFLDSSVPLSAGLGPIFQQVFPCAKCPTCRPGGKRRGAQKRPAVHASTTSATASTL